VVVHGFTGNPTSVRPLAEKLAARGFSVDVPRLPGHGTHWRDLARTRYADWRAAVDAALASMRPHVERLAVVGLSMGGLLALDAAIDRPDVDGVVTINLPFLDREGLLPKLAPLVARLVPALPASAAGLVKNDAARPGVDEKAYDMVPLAAAQSLLDQLPRVRAAATRLRRPALVVYSRDDHSVAPASSRALAGAIAAEVLVLERSYHLATLDHDAALLEERVAAFVGGLAARRDAA
jgi:carboxylesterase